MDQATVDFMSSNANRFRIIEDWQNESKAIIDRLVGNGLKVKFSEEKKELLLYSPITGEYMQIGLTKLNIKSIRFKFPGIEKY